MASQVLFLSKGTVGIWIYEAFNNIRFRLGFGKFQNLISWAFLGLYIRGGLKSRDIMFNNTFDDLFLVPKIS